MQSGTTRRCGCIVHHTSIKRAAEHWKMLKVKCNEETYNFLFDKTGVPASRYYDDDGIHLAHSGIRRLLDAIDRHVNIVDDFQGCVIRATRQPLNRNRPGQNEHRYKPHRGNGQRQINTENGQPRRPYQGNGIYRGNGSLRAPYAGNELTNAFTGNGESNRPNMGSDRLINRQLNGKWGGRKLCFYCSMPGHVIAECWYAQ